MKSIGKAAAIAMADSNWWEGKTPEEICDLQLFTEELCLPFSEFHKALTAALGRPVWTHELGLNYAGIVKEYLGEAEAPTMQEIIEMIPAEKRLLVVLRDGPKPNG